MKNMKWIGLLFIFSAAFGQEQDVALEEITYIHRLLQKAKSNVVREILQFPFYENDHYPKGDVVDLESNSQYYYHAHREEEHGHFHLFYRQKDGKPIHLIAISMDNKGIPIGLFTTNRWVTGESWHDAKEVCEMLSHFQIGLAHPSWLVNRWVTAIVRLFHSQIVALIHLRDKKIEEWKQSHPGIDVFEDRNLEVTSEMAISVEKQLQAVYKSLKKE